MLTWTRYARHIAAVLLAAWPMQFAALADEEVLRTNTGNPLKVIVREPTALRRTPDPMSESEPAEAFSFFYVLPVQAKGTEKIQNGFYRVASSATARRQAGWIAADKVVEWSHAQVCGFTPSNGRQPVLFFKSADDVKAWLKGEDGAESRAISREPSSIQRSLFPLLDIIPAEHERGKLDIYKVAYVAAKGRTSAPSNAPPTVAAKPAPKDNGPTNREELKSSFVLQVTFVIDTTASMQPWIEKMKVVISRISETLANNPALKGRVEFGLVCYRDELAPDTAEETRKQMEYVTRRVCDLTPDHKSFLEKLGTVHEAPVTSEDTPEDVLAGLKMAIQENAWKKAGNKHIVLIADAPAQAGTDGYKNVTKSTIPGIVTLAQPTGQQATWDRIQIHGLRIVSDLEVECERHVTEITTGREYPGLHYAYRGESDADKFVNDLTAKLSDLATTTQQVVAGQFEKVQEQAAQTQPGTDRHRLLGPVLDMIRATEGESSVSQTFQEGYAAVLDREGNKCLEPQVLVSQAQLKLFNSALNHCIVALETSGDPGNRNVPKLVQSLQILATGINLKEDVHPDMPLAEILAKVLGFPVRNPVFAITPSKLAAMTAADYQRWVTQVRASQSICASHLENGSIWFSLGRTTGNKSQETHAFIKVSDLP
ncbi:MAG: VWA domain-containing protein [Planctomycetaceae bacterium]|nr:VWA domain-containing protein [Planctomycetaceae bacterium]